MDIEQARDLLLGALKDWADADELKREADARIESDKLLVQAAVTRFPELRIEVADAALLADWGRVPGDETPKGSDAVLQILQVHENAYFTVQAMVNALEERGWLPNSANPPNAVRTALERLVATPDSGVVKDARGNGAVSYAYYEPKKGFDEEPF
jgi:hypothetical protein